jgi:hypothetical protein
MTFIVVLEGDLPRDGQVLTPTPRAFWEAYYRPGIIMPTPNRRARCAGLSDAVREILTYGILAQADEMRDAGNLDPVDGRINVPAKDHVAHLVVGRSCGRKDKVVFGVTGNPLNLLGEGSYNGTAMCQEKSQFYLVIDRRALKYGLFKVRATSSRMASETISWKRPARQASST